MQNQQVCFPHLPLAIYLEIAAHLRQVASVQVRLLPQLTTVFDYLDSQVGGLGLEYSADVQSQVMEILSYYSDRYGAFTVISDQ